MNTTILHPTDADCEPELTEASIPWGLNGLSVGEGEVGDEASYRELARAAIHALARLTPQLQRANLLIIAQRDEIRALHLEVAA